MAKAKKTGKEKLADGAKAIRDAEQKAKDAVPERVEIPKSTRSMQEVVRDRVVISAGNIGLKIAEDTPIEESLQILDWATALSDHVGFMVGDALNFGSTKWGNKYTAALNQTGRAKSTLWGYAEASRKIPLERRQTALSFSHHREILRLPEAKIDEVLKEVGAQAEKGNAPSTKELRFKIQKLTPKKRKTTKVTSGKGKKGKKKPEPPPYEPTGEEQGHLDEAEDSFKIAVKLTKGLYQIVGRLDNKEKARWMDMIEPIVVFYNAVDKVRGY
jgi:hypothetical protein